jgi:phosphate starvation-inducible protein PhoH and related proteins
MTEPTLTLEDTNLARIVFGEKDRHVDQIERALGIQVLVRGNQLTFRGDPEACRIAHRIAQELYDIVKRGYPLKAADVEISIRMLRQDPSQKLSEIFLETIGVSTRHQFVTPKTRTQKIYTDAIRKNDIVFSWGPAGTGKTYLAMAMAVSFLMSKQVDRIILTRPAVEAGEKLGFLPGDLAEKVNPYLRPLYDALHDMMDFDKAQKLVERGVIEVAPLAFMRGRTLSNSFVILDEAQNTTSDQMKMFLTRLGFDSKAVITGDITQVDLPVGKSSGMVEAIDLLKGIEGISVVEFTDLDVVRHPLVARIVRAYAAAENPRS